MKDDKMVHPFFDIVPENAATLEIIIDVKNSANTDQDEINRGCVGVYVLNKIIESTGFEAETQP